MELHHKLVESTEDGDLMFALDTEVWIRKRHNPKKHRQSKRNGLPMTNTDISKVAQAGLQYPNNLSL